MKKILITIVAVFVLVLATACGTTNNNNTSSNTSGTSGKQAVVKVGISPAELPTWTLVKNLAKKQNINIQLVQFSDYVQPNLALSNGDLDLNAFQTIIYFNAFKQQHNLDLSAIGTTAIWPMGIYSKKLKNIKDIKDGSLITVPNDATNLSRALALLQKAGLLKLSKDFNGTQGLEAITANPKHLNIKPVDAGQTARDLDDAAASIINSDMAINAGMNPTKDPIFRENASNKAYINIIAAQTKNKTDKTYQKIVNIYHTKEVQDFIKQQYKGAAVPVVMPINEATNY